MQIDTKTGFLGFKRALSLQPEHVIEIITQSGLKGRGGANFPTGLKWKATAECGCGQKVIICNADEGEPGTFKDKYILTHNPEALIEGIAIAGYAIGAEIAYIYLRGEYKCLKKDIEHIIKARSAELKRIRLRIEIILGAGAYICGDETAIMNSIMEERGEPNPKPPYPVEVGLCECPTSINNVETLTNVPLIMLGKWKDERLFSVSGSVVKPGIYQAPLGITADQLMSMAEPKERIKALFFGCAGGCVRYYDDLSLDVDTINGLGAMLGSCTVIAVGESVKIPEICRNIAQFFTHESCGKCTPCREGNFRVLQILDKIISGDAYEKDFEALKDLGELIGRTSLCGLGQASNVHIKTALQNFPEEFR